MKKILAASLGLALLAAAPASALTVKQNGTLDNWLDGQFAGMKVLNSVPSLPPQAKGSVNGQPFVNGPTETSVPTTPPNLSVVPVPAAGFLLLGGLGGLALLRRRTRA